MEIDRLMGWVEPRIDHGFEPPPYDEAQARTTLAAAGRSAADHAHFLQRWNGCYALGGLLHVFGACAEPPNHSLDAWNRSDGWRQHFALALAGVFLFAGTAFGDQFGYRDGKVVWFRARAGRVERLAPGFTDCLEALLLEPQRYLDAELFEACVARLGPLPHGGHFAPAAPQPPGARLDPARMQVVPARDDMEMIAAAAATFPVASARRGRPGG